MPSFLGLDQAWRRGVKISGGTVHYVTAEVDGGPIIDQALVHIDPEDTLETFGQKIHAAEHQLLPSVVARLMNCISPCSRSHGIGEKIGTKGLIECPT